MGDILESYLSPAPEYRKGRTIVLVGKVGNGKSGTGNSLIGKRVFVSKPSPVGVTGTCVLQSTLLEDGQTLNVIDTPGLLDYSREPEIIREEILNCLKMVKDGIHAIVLVLSVKSRYSVEEKDSVDQLLEFFGRKISDYMIVVFTGGDELDEIDETLDVFLDGCPDELTDILETCGNRRVLFDNKTKDDVTKSKQRGQFLSLVEKVVEKNDGKPFSNKLFLKLKNEEAKMREQAAEYKARMKRDTEKQMSEFKEKLNREYQEQHKKLIEEIDSRLHLAVENNHKLQLILAEEKAARLQAELRAQAVKAKADEEVRSLREEVKKAEDAAAARRRKPMCPIM